MFARNVSLRLKPNTLSEFTRIFDKEVIPMLRKQSGFRDEITFAVSGEPMTPKVQVGTILIEERPLIAQVLGLEIEPYSGNWSVIKGLDGFSLDRKIHTAGWNFFFIATEVKVMIFGALGATNIHSALKRILEKVRQQNFNCFEVTGIVAKRFWACRMPPFPDTHAISNRAACWMASKNGRRRKAGG